MTAEVEVGAGSKLWHGVVWSTKSIIIEGITPPIHMVDKMWHSTSPSVFTLYRQLYSPKQSPFKNQYDSKIEF